MGSQGYRAAISNKGSVGGVHVGSLPIKTRHQKHTPRPARIQARFSDQILAAEDKTAWPSASATPTAALITLHTSIPALSPGRSRMHNTRAVVIAFGHPLIGPSRHLRLRQPCRVLAPRRPSSGSHPFTEKPARCAPSHETLGLITYTITGLAFTHNVH